MLTIFIIPFYPPPYTKCKGFGFYFGFGFDFGPTPTVVGYNEGEATPRPTNAVVVAGLIKWS